MDIYLVFTISIFRLLSMTQKHTIECMFCLHRSLAFKFPSLSYSVSIFNLLRELEAALRMWTQTNSSVRALFLSCKTSHVTSVYPAFHPLPTRSSSFVSPWDVLIFVWISLTFHHPKSKHGASKRVMELLNFSTVEMIPGERGKWFIFPEKTAWL